MIKNIKHTEKELMALISQYTEILYDIDESLFISKEGRLYYNILLELEKENTLVNASNIKIADREDIFEIEFLESLFKKEIDIKNKDYIIANSEKNKANNLIERNVRSVLESGILHNKQFELTDLQSLRDTLNKSIDILERKDKYGLDINEWFERYHKTLVDRFRGINYSFGCNILDSKLMAGALPGTITTLFGPTGGGKSAFCLNLTNLCINKRIPCIYDSLEMDDISTLDRLLAIRTNLTMASFYNREKDLNEQMVFDMVEEQRKKMLEYKKVMFIDKPSQSIADIKYIIKEAQKKFKSEYLIFFCDLYSMVKGSGDSPQEIEDGMNRLHEIVKETKIHFVAVVQANRENEGHRPKDIFDTDKFKPTLKNIKNSGAYAERSRIVLSSFRPKYYAERYFNDDPDQFEALNEMEDIMRVNILKQNQGVLGEVKYLFEGNKLKVYPIVMLEKEKEFRGIKDEEEKG